MGGARPCGNKVSTREGSFPLDLMEKGENVANLVDSSFAIAKKHLNKLRKTSPCFSLNLPTPQTDRHHVVRKKFSDPPSHT